MNVELYNVNLTAGNVQSLIGVAFLKLLTTATLGNGPIVHHAERVGIRRNVAGDFEIRFTDNRKAYTYGSITVSNNEIADIVGNLSWEKDAINA